MQIRTTPRFRRHGSGRNVPQATVAVQSNSDKIIVRAIRIFFYTERKNALAYAACIAVSSQKYQMISFSSPHKPCQSGLWRVHSIFTCYFCTFLDIHYILNPVNCQRKNQLSTNTMIKIASESLMSQSDYIIPSAQVIFQVTSP